MTTSPNAHRTEFSVRCACGIEYHTSDAHVGRVLPCKCGRNVTVARPAAAESAPAGSTEMHRGRKVRRKHHATTGETERATALNWNHKRRTPRLRVAGLFRPIMRGRGMERATAIAAWLYCAGMLIAWLALIFTSERNIPATLLAYGPRWLSLWPLALLVPAALIFTRVSLWPIVAGALLGIGPIMGARVSFSTLFSSAMPATPSAGTFRVVTYNVQGGGRVSRNWRTLIRELQPDVVLIQECGDQLWKRLQRQEGWYSERYGSLCTTSRWKIGGIEPMLPEQSAGTGSNGMVLRAFIETPTGPLTVINLHLETARRGLEGMLSPEGLVPDDPFGTRQTAHYDAPLSSSENARRFTVNAQVRERESALASRWSVANGSTTPLVIGGDFNLPVESTIFREHWSSFTDAFEATGNGLGWTKLEGRWLRIRIDHLLTLPTGPRPIRVAVGPDYRSDHRPVIADYAWPNQLGKTAK